MKCLISVSNKLSLNVDKTVNFTFRNYCNSVLDCINACIKNEEKIKKLKELRAVNIWVYT